MHLQCIEINKTVSGANFKNKEKIEPFVRDCYRVIKCKSSNFSATSGTVRVIVNQVLYL